MAAPCDLNVCLNPDNSFPENFLLLAAKFGYRSFAINHNVSELTTSGSGKKNKSKDRFTVKKLMPRDALLNQLHQISPEIKLYSRVTVEVTSSTDLFRSLKSQLDEFDIVAVKPMDVKGFERLQTETDYDIITIDPTVRGLIKRGSIKPVMKKGLVFELNYGPCVADSFQRATTIQFAQDLLIYTKGKNIILSSGHHNDYFLRAPYDVVNLAVLFGMDHHIAKDCVNAHCKLALIHAESRKTIRSSISIMKCEVADGETKSERNSDSQPPAKKKKLK